MESVSSSRVVVRCCFELVLLLAMIRTVVKSFKVPDVEVVAARNESVLTRMTESTPKNIGQT